MSHARQTFPRLLLILATLLVVLTPFASDQQSRAADPVYPDLITAAPSALSIKASKLADGKSHYLLRFNNLIENQGGPLEIVANLSESRDLYQNVYDGINGGVIVLHKKIAADLIFHPTHNHFHLTDFANYALFVKAKNGTYRQTTRYSAKSTFCILDSFKFDTTVASNPTYTECDAQKQGLSHGWGDIYLASLPDQWIDLGTTMPSDGDYALHSTVDPRNRILESRDDNNTAVTRFSIRNGKLSSDASETAYCAAKPATAAVGDLITIACQDLRKNRRYDIRWRYPSSAPVTSAITDADGTLYASFIQPPTTRGAHLIHLTDPESGEVVRAVVETAATLAVSPASGPTGRSVSLTLTGFTAKSKVTISYGMSSTSWRSLKTVTTDANGSANLTTKIPVSVAGSHFFSAVETGGTTPSTAEYILTPTVRVSSSHVAAGQTVRTKLRGFGASDEVTLSLAETGATLTSIRVSRLGAAELSDATAFAIPADLPPGRYTLVASGAEPAVSATIHLTVSAPQSAAVAPSASVDPTSAPTLAPPTTSPASPTTTEQPATTIPTGTNPASTPEPTSVAQASPVG